MIRKIFWSALFCLALTACSDSESDSSNVKYILGTEDSDVSEALSGRFLLADSLVPVKLKITVVDEHLDSIKSVKATVVKNSDGSYAYVSDLTDYPLGYVKFTYTCLLADSTNKMKFVQYADLSRDSSPVLNIFEALESERVESLVKKEDFYLQQAKSKALREAYRMLDCEELVKSTENPLENLWWAPYLYSKYEIASSGKTFYKAYNEMRSSLGTGKSWRDFVKEAEVVDSLYSRFTNWYGPWGNKVSSFDEDYLPFSKIWAKYYGIELCVDSLRGDTVRIANKKSAFYNEKLICDPHLIASNACWRPLMDIEKDIGFCATKDTTVVYKDLVYQCKTGWMRWFELSTQEAVKHLYGKCLSNMIGEVVTYDSAELTCLCADNYNHGCEWKKGVPEDSVGKFSPVDAFVKKTEGECTEKREGERIAVNDAFYICKSNFWENLDKKTYYLGKCDSTRNNEKVFDKNVGAFRCENKSGWIWNEILLPIYYGDACNRNLQSVIKQYEDNYFVCDSSNWKVANDKFLTAPVLHGFICDSSKTNSAKEIDGKVYLCEMNEWKEMNPYESKSYRARIRNKIPDDYCNNGMEKTTLVWDKEDSLLYGCVNVHKNGYQKLWRAVDYSTVTRSIDDYYYLKSVDNAFFGSSEKIAGGKFTSESTYEIDFKGRHYIFNVGSYSFNGDYYGSLSEREAVVDGVRYQWFLKGDKEILRKSVGDTTVSLGSIQGASANFGDFFKDWMQQIVESSQCPNPVRPTIDCARKTRDSAHQVLAMRYGPESYVTFEKAKSICPKGYHLPDTTEWRTVVEKVPRLESSLVVHQHKNYNSYYYEVRYNLFWTADEKDKDTQYCYEYIRDTRERFYGYQIAEDSREFSDSDVVAGDVKSCPKNLYPMVQALCISDEVH